MKRIKARKVINVFIYLLLVFMLLTVLKYFCFSMYKISNISMSPTLLSGDYIFVNKLIPGPRLIINASGGTPKLKRFKGYKTVKRNDILVFNPLNGSFPKLTSFYVKRCIGIPGDTFYIDNGFFKIKNVSDTLGNYFSQQILSEKMNVEFEPNVFNCFPFDSAYGWNVKQFGPLYIPMSGDTIGLDTLNIKLYKRLIYYETGKQITIENDAVFLDDSIVNKYVFKHNYYFMAGDWVLNSNDSRYWGLLPEDHIVGKVSFVWNSKDITTKKTR
jgi:signal peptidase I